MNNTMSGADKLGVLLVNTGTPDSPNKADIRAYLKRFLLDRRIVNLPPWLWRPILQGIILRVRPAKTQRIYQAIWTPQGSPYTLYSQGLEAGLQAALTAAGFCATTGSVPLPTGQPSTVQLRMVHRYGNPSLAAGLAQFQAAGIGRLVVLPLFAQETLATTHTIHDELQRQLAVLAYAPTVDFIWDYHLHPAWIAAVANSLRPYLLAGAGRAHLLFSFHSTPIKDRRHGDPYIAQVQASCAAIAQQLQLDSQDWSLAYQSRFDDTQRWEGPFLEPELTRLLANCPGPIVICCPGFAVDCTETLYDIKSAIAQLPGAKQRVQLVPCLNDSAAHVQALLAVLQPHLDDPGASGQ